MGAGHMLKFHLLLPAAIAGGLLLFGLPLSTALLVGMMAGCMSMVFMMGSGASHDHARPDDADEKDPTHDQRLGRGR